jgi:hypothetical protein
MQILFTNDFDNGGQTFTQAQKDSFLADERTAINIYNATFTNNITVTLNFGFGSIDGKMLAKQDEGAAQINARTTDLLTYSQLSADLRTFGEPNFFNVANLPEGDSINGISPNFLISSSITKVFGMPVPNPMNLPDGFIGIGTDASKIAPGAQRISVFLHEIGHALGRATGPFINSVTGATYVSPLDLVRFTTQGIRFFVGAPTPPPATYFSIDGGVNKLADWSSTSPDDFLGPPLTPDDPFNQFINSATAFTDADILLMEALGFRLTNPSPPPGTTAVMVLGHSSDGRFGVYNIGSNAILAGHQLSGQIGNEWQFVALAGFFGNNPSDMVFRNVNTGGFEVYNLSNNNITNSALLGNVGLDWQVIGFGNFGAFGRTDMMMTRSNNGVTSFEAYGIRDSQITSAGLFGQIGTEWQVAGFGPGNGTTDMVVGRDDGKNVITYGLYRDINNNRFNNFSIVGSVGSEWTVVGFADLAGIGRSDMIVRRTGDNAFGVYRDINNNRFTAFTMVGPVGFEWQVMGFGPIGVAGRDEMVVRRSSDGMFGVYAISNNQFSFNFMGAVGTDWQFGGVAAANSRGAGAAMGNSIADSSNAQLVQAMAGFGGGAADSWNALALGADTPQQTFLTTPHA